MLSQWEEAVSTREEDIAINMVVFRGYTEGPQFTCNFFWNGTCVRGDLVDWYDRYVYVTQVMVVKAGARGWHNGLSSKNKFLWKVPEEIPPEESWSNRCGSDDNAAGICRDAPTLIRNLCGAGAWARKSVPHAEVCIRRLFRRWCWGVCNYRITGPRRGYKVTFPVKLVLKRRTSEQDFGKSCNSVRWGKRGMEYRNCVTNVYKIVE